MLSFLKFYLHFKLFSHYKIYLPNSKQMSLAQTNHSVNCTIDFLLDNGAAKLYDKYITQKLPQHTYAQNNTTFYNNLSVNQVTQSTRDAINVTPLTMIKHIPIDTRAPKRISVKKQMDGYSTLSPKNTTFCKSTKYQTIIKSQKESVDKEKNIQNLSDSMNLQEQNLSDIPISVRKTRPMTMQTARNHQHALNLQSKLEEVEQKRAMTCHTRKRKPLNISKEKPQKFFKISQEVPAYIRQEIELTNRLRKHRKERQDQQDEKNHEKDKIDAYIKLKQKRTKQNFQELRSKIKGKSKQTPPLTNFQTDNGAILINGKPKQQKTHIVQLQFNPEDELITSKMQSKVSGVNGTKKSSFVAKLKKKTKITNEEYTNNGGRQISSIPFMSLNCGIVLSQSTIQATASRRRPAEQVSRSQFTISNQSQRFVSHNPLINSARVNVYATIDEAANQTVKSSYFQNSLTERKQYETTLDSKKQMTGSILWRVREKSEHKKIRISNLEAFNQQILQIKLAH